MARNATESDFWIFKMAAGSHFVKKNHKIKIVVLIWNGKKCDTKLFLDIQNGYQRPFKKNTFTKKVVRVIWTMFEPTAGWLQLDINSLLVNIYIHIQTAMLRTREYGMHTILVDFVCGHKYMYIVFFYAKSIQNHPKVWGEGRVWDGGYCKGCRVFIKYSS